MNLNAESIQRASVLRQAVVGWLSRIVPRSVRRHSCERPDASVARRRHSGSSIFSHNQQHRTFTVCVNDVFSMLLNYC